MSRGLDSYRHGYVFRTLRPDECPYSDIVCKDRNSKRNICEHVEDGLKYPSRFISTSASFYKAQRWIGTSNGQVPPRYSHLKRRDTIVKIDVTQLKRNYPRIANSAYDFTDCEVRDNFLSNDVQNGYARGYEEVVFEYSIPSELVSDIYVVGRGWVEKMQATSIPELVIHSSTMVTTGITHLAVNTPINTSPPPSELTLSTHSQSATCNTVSSIQVDTIKRVNGTARFKRKLTYEDVEPPLKYTCRESQVTFVM